MLTFPTLKKSYSPLAMLLVAFIATATVAEENVCNEPLMNCLNNHVTRFTPSLSTAETCGVLKEFSECIMAIGCLPQQMKEEIIVNVTASFKTFVDCDQALEQGMPSVPEEGTGSEQSSGDIACTESRNNCTKSFVEKSFQAELHVQDGEETEGYAMKDWFCPNLNEYLYCLRNAPCEGENYDATLRQDMESTMRKAGISCDLDALDGWTDSGETDMGVDKQDSAETDGDSEDLGGNGEDSDETTEETESDSQEGQDESQESDNEKDASGEQAEATLTDPRNSASSFLPGFSAATVLLSLVASLAILARH